MKTFEEFKKESKEKHEELKRAYDKQHNEFFSKWHEVLKWQREYAIPKPKWFMFLWSNCPNCNSKLRETRFESCLLYNCPICGYEYAKSGVY